ncbi:unnamed protein product [Adineta steineri]|uniref:Uncharacterized protein n=1 Tax=Adineta steineri TaxID=433720 RepID=A0A815T1K8_9BILA|nr:unnamed protein product [Adineta steineri]
MNSASVLQWLKSFVQDENIIKSFEDPVSYVLTEKVLLALFIFKIILEYIVTDPISPTPCIKMLDDKYELYLDYELIVQTTSAQEAISILIAVRQHLSTITATTLSNSNVIQSTISMQTNENGLDVVEKVDSIQNQTINDMDQESVTSHSLNHASILGKP